jgi:rhamnogalacturonan hydrolase
MALRQLLIASLVSTAASQLSNPVGPTTDAATKGSNKVCDITDYGAEDGSDDDVGPAISDAWEDCKAGGLVYIPPGSYALQSNVKLSGGSSSAVQWDGTIYRDAELEDHMFYFQDSTDFELFSGNSEGALQGYGYEYIQDGEFGARFMRFTNVQDWSFHGLALIDSPAYYVVVEDCSNGEMYNLILRGIAGIGETDGIDIWSDNIWVHDVEVTNGDECVTVKSPASNLLIESIHCNLSGGTAIGSLGLNTDIHDVEYNRLYMNEADACYLKTNNGNGTVADISWTDVYINGGAYVLAINEAWGDDIGSDGVQISGLTFKVCAIQSTILVLAK